MLISNQWLDFCLNSLVVLIKFSLVVTSFIVILCVFWRIYQYVLEFVLKVGVTYYQTLLMVLAALSVTLTSIAMFLWLNQQGLDHSWQQEQHEPSPWSQFSFVAWQKGGHVEEILHTYVKKIEETLAPYQDIMSENIVDDAMDHNKDDSLDGIDEEPLPIPSKSKPSRVLEDKPKLSLSVPTQSESNTKRLSSAVKKNHLSENISHSAPTATLTDTKIKSKRQEEDHIVFIGDSMMQGVAPHAVTALRRRYHIKSYDLSLQSTGLTYPKFFNWPETLKNFLNEKKGIKTLVVFLGPNDPWNMASTTHHGHYLEFHSVMWEEDYRGRIRSILNLAKEHNVNVIWIGPPATKRKRLSDGLLFLDKLYQSEVERAGQTYVSVDDLFGYSHHQYNETMLRDGHYVRLRTDDGTHFSITGQKIIAAAVMQLLRPSIESSLVP